MEQSITKQSKGIDGSSLKIIAIAVMFIDHLAATVLEGHILSTYGSIYLYDMANMTRPAVLLYFAMRIIGRLGFPIFIFLMIEGFEHTRNRWKYLQRLAIFALISEIPFDMAFNYRRLNFTSGKIFELTYQNVFFTLAIGLFVLIIIKMIEEADLDKYLKIILIAAIVIAGMVVAEVLRTDYSAFGVLAIVVMYLLRKNRINAVIWTCVTLTFASVLEIAALIVLLPISRYNGKRGLSMKYVFYAFYPVHLLLLRGVCMLLGI